MELVNVCGIPENRFDRDGWCRECRHTCEMIPAVMIDKHIYDYAKRNGIIKGEELGSTKSMFSKSEFISYFFNSPSRYKRAPKYVKKYLKDLGICEYDIMYANERRFGSV